MASNLDDVLNQMREAGLLDDSKTPISHIKQIGKIVRCYTEEDHREKRGWYVLHEMRLRSGDDVLVGSFGVYHGEDNGARKIVLSGDYQQTADDKAAFRKKMADDRKQQEAYQKNQQEAAALLSEKVWRKLSNHGECDYLDRKKINNYGARFTGDSKYEISRDEIPDLYQATVLEKIPKNSLTIPVLDTSGKIFGLEFILDRASNKERIEKTGTDKLFFPPGMAKKGHFYMIGSPQTSGVVLVTEGYATGATLREATGLPVAICFDAGNISPAIESLKTHYPKIKILICADDDCLAQCISCKEKIDITHSETCPVCKNEHGRKNAGVNSAIFACSNSDIRWVSPQFNDDQARFEHFKSNKGKLSDFNDLFLTDGLHSVTAQIETAINENNWQGKQQLRVVQNEGGGEKRFLAPIDSTDELLERFYLVYGKGGVVFDSQEHCLVTLSDMRDACQFRDTHKRWHESRVRKIVRPENLGFDPACKDKDIICNLWRGWPNKPKEGKCDAVLSLFAHMCSGENNSVELAAWGLKWHAYPLQNPGAKMQTAMVIHGPQGTGKNFWTETFLQIYGEYGGLIDQAAIEDKHNDYLSRKLYLIADEIVARADRYHIKNQLKGLITNKYIRINPKHFQSYQEANHANIVFLSNERIPVVLEEDDRRHFVIWTPPPKPPEFYKQVQFEIENGGIEALYYYLLSIDLGDFNEHSKPPMTIAKRELIDLSKDSILRFYEQWKDKQIDGVPFDIPAPNEGVYEFYRAWCGHEGIKPQPKNTAMDRFAKIPGITKERKDWVFEEKFGKKFFYMMPGCKEKDINDSEKYFFGRCLDEFNDYVKVYRGGS
jgi:putative DNA primase/helicase